MTFERFYSIIRPHKAASFNTVKRTKITILIIVIVTGCMSACTSTRSSRCSPCIPGPVRLVRSPKWSSQPLLYSACMDHVLITHSSFSTIQSQSLNHMHITGNQSGDRVISWTNGSMTCKSVFLLSPQCVYLSNCWSKWDESSVKPS